jgi:hypothetical protein
VGQAGKEIPPQWDMAEIIHIVLIDGEKNPRVILPFLADAY